ncbi:hypothetical protein PanWU01x14_022330, partial [Parasponia andersonii]
QITELWLPSLQNKLPLTPSSPYFNQPPKQTPKCSPFSSLHQPTPPPISTYCHTTSLLPSTTFRSIVGELHMPIKTRLEVSIFFSFMNHWWSCSVYLNVCLVIFKYMESWFHKDHSHK